MTSLILAGTIGGERVSSKNMPSRVSDPMGAGRKHNLSPRSRLIAALIPVYPDSVSIFDLSRQIGIDKRSLEANLTTLEGRHLICQEGPYLSRLEDTPCGSM